MWCYQLLMDLIYVNLFVLKTIRNSKNSWKRWKDKIRHLRVWLQSSNNKLRIESFWIKTQSKQKRNPILKQSEMQTMNIMIIPASLKVNKNKSSIWNKEIICISIARKNQLLSVATTTPSLLREKKLWLLRRAGNLHRVSS